MPFLLISLGQIFFPVTDIFIPACFANRIRSEYTAGIYHFLQSHTNGFGQAVHGICCIHTEQDPQMHKPYSHILRSLPVIFPALYAPTASNILESVSLLPLTGQQAYDHQQKIVGILSLAAAITIPYILITIGNHN